MTQNFAEIARDITIAAIGQGLIINDGKNPDRNTVELVNENNAEAVGKLYKTIAKHVADVINGNLDTKK